jgi:hypothetical protein
MHSFVPRSEICSELTWLLWVLPQKFFGGLPDTLKTIVTRSDINQQLNTVTFDETETFSFFTFS